MLVFSGFIQLIRIIEVILNLICIAFWKRSTIGIYSFVKPSDALFQMTNLNDIKITFSSLPWEF